MSEYYYINNNISVKSNLSLWRLIYILYNCKPLVPSHPLKRWMLINQYLYYYKRKKTVQLPIKHQTLVGDILIETNEKYKLINMKNKKHILLTSTI